MDKIIKIKEETMEVPCQLSIGTAIQYDFAIRLDCDVEYEIGEHIIATLVEDQNELQILKDILRIENLSEMFHALADFVKLRQIKK